MVGILVGALAAGSLQASAFASASQERVTPRQLEDFRSKYQPVSDCIDRYFAAHPAGASEVAAHIAKAGQLANFERQATAMLGAASMPPPPRRQTADERVVAFMQALGGLAGSDAAPRSARVGALAIGVLYQTYATGGNCQAGPEFNVFIETVSK